MDRVLANLSPLTQYAILFISLVGLSFHVRWSRRSVALGPTLLTTLGIFFCFMGIAIGLADFDPNNVKTSVPHLLQGIRTSFWVSVCGIGWALTLKIRVAVFGEAALVSTGDAHNATIDDLAAHLHRIHLGIAADDASSVTGQLAITREQTVSRLEQLTVALQTHARHAAEENSKALTQALSTVVRDFNASLNEQFGQNFQQLNVAAGRLADWQTQHLQQLTERAEAEKRATAAMTEAAKHFAHVVEESKTFAATAASLSTIIETMNAQREQLTANLQVLAGLLDGAAVGVPRMAAAIVEMTEQITLGVRNNQDSLGAVLKSSWQSVQVHNTHLAAMLKKSLDAAGRDVKTHDDAMSDARRADATLAAAG